MRRPLILREVEADAFRPPGVEKARHAPGKARRLDRVVEGIAKLEDAGIGCVGGHLDANLATRRPFR